MSIKTVDESSGRFEIQTGDITKNDIKKWAVDTRIQIIQLKNPIINKEIELLENELFSKRPDISFRVYGHKCDLSFLERMPSLRNVSADCLIDASNIEAVTKLKNLETLCVGIFNLDNFDFLKNISPKIKKLTLLETRSKKPKIDCISRFTDLEYLYLEGQQKGIASIACLKKLQDITLRSISTKDVDYLSELENLWSVDIKLGGIKNFDALTTLPKLKYLELWQVRGLSDLSFMSDLPTLQNLFLQSLIQVTKMPNLNRNISLKRIVLENLKGLTDLTALKFAPNLKEFKFVGPIAAKLEPEDLLPLLENPMVEKVSCYFSGKKYAYFRELIEKHKKQEYKSSKFKYE